MDENPVGAALALILLGTFLGVVLFLVWGSPDVWDVLRLAAMGMCKP